MTSFDIDNIKDFMAALFKSSVFDDFFVHGASVTTFTTFDISGRLNKEFLGEETERLNCFWREVKPFIFSLIKGSRLPKQMKIVLSAPENIISSIDPSASAMSVNIIYENASLKIITGFSQKTFSLNNSSAAEWDKYVEKFLKSSGFSVSTQF